MGTTYKVLQGHPMRPESSFKMKVVVSVILLVMQRNCSNRTVTKLVKSVVLWIFRKMELILLFKKQCYSLKSGSAVN
jgi:hypothetical protein